MKIALDKKNDIMRIIFREGKYALSEEVSDGIIIDRSSDKKVLAIEILDVSEKIPVAALRKVELSSS